jgi:cell division protein FtsQ
MTAAAPPTGPDMDARIAERRAAVAYSRRRNRRRWLFSATMLVGLVAVAMGVAASPLFDVTRVVIAGTQGEETAEVRSVIGIDVGDNLLGADVHAAAEAVTALPWVKDAEVTRSPPASVEVRVDRRDPFAVVRLPDESWTVDEEGVVLAGGAVEGLVEIDAPSSSLPRPGEAATDEAVTSVLTFHAGLPDLFATRVRRYEAPSPTGIRMRVDVTQPSDQQVWVRVGTSDDVTLKAEVAEAILEQAEALLGPDGPGVREVDVRAPANPVLIPLEET